MLALVVQGVLARDVQEDPVLTVPRERVVFVRVPKPLRHLYKFEAPPVAGVVVVMLLTAEVPGGAGVATSDDVPAGPAPAYEVQ